MKRVGGMGFREIMCGFGDHEDYEILRAKIRDWRLVIRIREIM